MTHVLNESCNFEESGVRKEEHKLVEIVLLVFDAIHHNAECQEKFLDDITMRGNKKGVAENAGY